MKKKFAEAHYTINTEETGDRLKRFRRSMHLTLGALAEECGLSIGMLSETESGHNKPSPNLMFAMNKLYNLNINWLLTGEGEPVIQKFASNYKKNNNIMRDCESLLWFMEKVPMIKYAVLSFFSRYYLENKDIIEKTINYKSEKG